MPTGATLQIWSGIVSDNLLNYKLYDGEGGHDEIVTQENNIFIIKLSTPLLFVIIIIPSDAFFWFGIEDFATKHAKQKSGASYQYLNTHKVTNGY